MDIGGRAIFPSSDVTKNYCYSLSSDDRSPEPHVEYLNGDVMDAADFKKRVNYVVEKEGGIDFIAIESVGGFARYAPRIASRAAGVSIEAVEKTLSATLVRRLAILAKALNKDGLLLIGRNLGYKEYLDVFANVCRKLGLELINDSRYGKLLLRKS